MQILRYDDGRCPRCPLRPGLRCAGVEIPRLCQLVDPGHAAYDASYLSALTIDGGAAEPAPRRPLGESLILLRAVRSCPHRSDRPDCGCAGGSACGRGRGRDGLVSLADCFDCQSETHVLGTAPTGEEK